MIWLWKLVEIFFFNNYLNNNVVNDANINFYFIFSLKLINFICQSNNNYATGKDGSGGCLRSENCLLRNFTSVTIIDSLSNQKAVGIIIIDDDLNIANNFLKGFENSTVFFNIHFKLNLQKN